MGPLPRGGRQASSVRQLLEEDGSQVRHLRDGGNHRAIGPRAPAGPSPIIAGPAPPAPCRRRGRWLPSWIMIVSNCSAPDAMIGRSSSVAIDCSLPGSRVPHRPVVLSKDRTYQGYRGCGSPHIRTTATRSAGSPTSTVRDRAGGVRSVWRCPRRGWTCSASSARKVAGEQVAGALGARPGRLPASRSAAPRRRTAPLVFRVAGGSGSGEGWRGRPVTVLAGMLDGTDQPGAARGGRAGGRARAEERARE